MTDFFSFFNRFNNHIALIDGASDERYSYQMLYDHCLAFKTHFPEKKSLIAIAAKNSVETVIAYLSALMSNQSVLLYDASINHALIQQIFETYQPAMHIIDGQIHLHAYENETSELHPDLALCLSTSGSTGSPKLVRLTLKNIISNTHAIIQYLGLSETDIAITSLPLHYSFGLSILNTHLAAGATIVLTEDSIVTREFWDTFKKYNISSFSGVPSHYEMLEKMRIFRSHFPSLKTLTQAGGKLPVELAKKVAAYAEKYSIDFYIMYGQTEACARMAYLPPSLVHTKPNAMGKAIPGGEFFLIDTEGHLIHAPNTTGELVYHGENVMMGYATCREDLAKADEMNQTLATGDLASFDEEGIFYIQGRLKRFLKIHGNRFSLDQIEEQLSHYECICGGEDNRLVVLTKQEASIKDIEDLLKTIYQLHHSNYIVIHRTAFPMTSNGKIQYHELREMLV